MFKLHILLILLIPSFCNGLDFGESCLKNPDYCEPSLYLICTEIAVGQLVCRCNELVGFESPTTPGLCLKYAEVLGEACEVNRQCDKILGSSCDGSSCECDRSSNYFQYNDECIKYTQNLNDHCLLSHQCQKIPHSYCSPWNQTCICLPDDYFQHPQLNVCFKYAEQLRDDCIAGSDQCDLIPGAICTVSKCQCDTTNYFEDDSASFCLPFTVTLYSPCIPGTKQCDKIAGSFCNPLNETCTCDTNHFQHPLQATCLKYSDNLKDECLPNSQQCSRIDGATCPSSGMCECNDTAWFESPSGGACLEYATSLYDPCLPATSQCDRIPGSYCHPANSTCSCDLDHFQNPALYQCEPYANQLGESCIPSTDQCHRIQGSECNPSSRSCECDRNHFQNPAGNCIPLGPTPGGQCLDNIHCAGVMGTICQDGSCVCDTINRWDLAPDAARCLKRAEYLLESCDIDSQCREVTKTQCRDMACRCIPDNIPSSSNRYCLPIVYFLGRPCEEEQQCLDGIGSNSQCPVDACTCKEGYIGDGEELQDHCLLISDISNPCTKPIQCETTLGPESECRLGYCACNSNAAYMDTKCWRKIPINSMCSDDRECIVGTNNLAFCSPSKGFCDCLPTAEYYMGTCRLKVGVGEECLTDDDCKTAINGTVFCRDNKCACQLGSSPSLDGRICSESIMFLPQMMLVLFALMSYIVL